MSVQLLASEIPDRLAEPVFTPQSARIPSTLLEKLLSIGISPYHAHCKCDILEFVENRLHKFFCCAPIHHRMPLVLRREQVESWLLEPKEASVLLHTVPPELDVTSAEAQLSLW